MSRKRKITKQEKENKEVVNSSQEIENKEVNNSFNIFKFIYYNFISYKEERSIFFSGICRGLLYYYLFTPLSDLLFSIDTKTTISGLIFVVLAILFCWFYFMQIMYTITYTLGYHAEYIDPSRIVTRSSSSQNTGSYGNINSALEYGDAIMNQKSNFGKVDYIKENPHMLLKQDSKNVQDVVKYIDTMIGMKPAGEARAKELKKYYKS
jgi:hypothetical protein